MLLKNIFCLLLRIQADNVDDSSETETEESVPDLDDPDVQLAASRIQSAFKGLKDRKRVQALKQAKEENKAATLLQAHFKG